MKIRWLQDVELSVVTEFDELTETPCEEPETFKKNTSSDVDILNTYPKTVDMQFGDGSVAFNVPNSAFTIKVGD